jgi:hypothetical protein
MIVLQPMNICVVYTENILLKWYKYAWLIIWRPFIKSVML